MTEDKLKRRIIDLRRQVTIARKAFKRILSDEYIRPNAEEIASDALEAMDQKEPR
jgi:hypothetical protein